MLLLADKLYIDADFFVQLDLTLVHTAKSTRSWLIAIVLLCLIHHQTVPVALIL